MGIFSGNISTGLSNDITKNDTFESLMESNIEELDCDDFEEGSMDSIVTMNENYNMIMTAIGIGEAVTFERTGKEFIWTEGTLSDFVGKIKSFLKKIWDKIKGLFKRAIAMFDSYNMQDKAFVKKYRKEIFSGKNLSDFKFKGYEFENVRKNNTCISSALGECADQAEAAIEAKFNGNSAAYEKDKGITLANYSRKGSNNDADDDRESLAHKDSEKINDDIEVIRGAILDKFKGKSPLKTGSYSADEFRKEIKEWLHDGSMEKEELDNININDLTTWLVGSKTTNKTLSDAFKQSKKLIDVHTKNVERAQKEDWNSKPETSDDAAVKDRAGARAVDLGRLLTIVRSTSEMVMTIDGLMIAALKECSRQSKAILVKVMHYNPKSESYNESYSGGDYSSYSGSNFLAGVELK